ncbi:septation protein SepH [uncultured Jatrophihabitans sp.]|uniref:septation protein SepH n=1 Tax=uncultured Jatrophihabitans sp. TaxID=1610747 RepID=UPI0035C98C27
MRQLRLVGIADDHSHVVLDTADGPERFALLPDSGLDAALRSVAAASAPAEPAVPASAPAEPVASVSSPDPSRELPFGPREIQVRVRAGESPAEVAESYGVAVERIMRFAAPVLEERVRIADEARRARARRSKGDAGEGVLVVFGEAVDARFAAHGIDATTVAWSSRRREDGEWVVRADWRGGEGTHGAEWAFRRSSRSVTALDDTASDLLSDRPIRPVVPQAPERPSLVAAPPLAPGVVAFPPPMPEAPTEPLPVVEHVFDQEAPDRLQELGFLSDDSAEAELDFDAPPLPLGITDPSTRPAAVNRLTSVRNIGGGKREESEDERAARVKVPSWDDILLGVRRKQD